MLEQLVECENRLLEEQRRFNELLLAWRSGDLGDDLTRMKIDQMQREVDALGRQLTALRTVIAAQAARERAGYRQGAMPKAAYGWPAYGQPGAAAQPWNHSAWAGTARMPQKKRNKLFFILPRLDKPVNRVCKSSDLCYN